MKITKAIIKNFRLLKNLTVDFDKELSLIIGKNNSGKTSFVDIFKKFFENEKFSINDFSIDVSDKIRRNINNNLNKKKEDIVYEEFAISLDIFIEYSEEDDTSVVSEFFMDLSDRKDIQIRFEYVLSEEKNHTLLEKCQEYIDKFNKNNTEDADKTNPKSIDNYLKNHINEYFKTRIRSVNIENPNDLSDDKELNAVKSLINIKYINAKRDVSNDGNKHTLSTLAKRYYEIAKDDESLDIRINLERSLQKSDTILTENFKVTFKTILEDVQKFSYGTKENVVEIISNLTESIVESTIVNYNAWEDIKLPENYNGLGYLNFIAILFDLSIQINDLKRNNGKPICPINLLFIEEPEAHTHPQMQYVFIRNINKFLTEKCQEKESPLQLQTLITTHSSHIVSQSDFNQIKYFHKFEQSGVINIIAKNLSSLAITNEDSKFLKQYITLNRAEFFFSEKVILIEGDTERLLIIAMMKKIDIEHEKEENYIPLLSQNISVIEVGNYSHKFLPLLGFLGVKVLILTDLDCAKPTESKDGKIRDSKCLLTEATTTTNESIKHFFPYDESKEKEYINSLVNADLKKRIFAYNEEDKTWIVSENGTLLLEYQQTARSFEESFISENKEFFISNIDNEDNKISLRENFKVKSKEVSDDNFNAYEIAENLDRKTTFAFDILNLSNENYSNWNIPKYIKEGLEWIIK